MHFERRTLRETIASLLAVFLLLSFGPVAALAQTETGPLTIKATDRQGAVVPGATVNVKSTATSAEGQLRRVLLASSTRELLRSRLLQALPANLARYSTDPAHLRLDVRDHAVFRFKQLL